MPHIAVQREDETGKTLASFDVSGIDSRIVRQAPAHSACLRFIDPYGDFLANQLQLPVLVAELKEIALTSSDQPLKDNINRLVSFLNESVEVHTYVRFIGD